ncbi:hypothetical protein ES703_74085 [subsurface metagenome]
MLNYVPVSTNSFCIWRSLFSQPIIELVPASILRKIIALIEKTSKEFDYRISQVLSINKYTYSFHI